MKTAFYFSIALAISHTCTGMEEKKIAMPTKEVLEKRLSNILTQDFLIRTKLIQQLADHAMTPLAIGTAVSFAYQAYDDLVKKECSAEVHRDRIWAINMVRPMVYEALAKGGNQDVLDELERRGFYQPLYGVRSKM